MDNQGDSTVKTGGSEETSLWDTRHLDTRKDCEDRPRRVDRVLMVAWGSRSGPEPGPGSDPAVSVSRASSQRSSDLLLFSQAAGVRACVLILSGS